MPNPLPRCQRAACAHAAAWIVDRAIPNDGHFEEYYCAAHAVEAQRAAPVFITAIRRVGEATAPR